MSTTVRINEKIKEEVTPILSELGISLSEAINMFLHQVKINNGIPFELKRKPREINDGNGSYVCEYGNLHNYNKLNIEEIEKEAKSSKKYKNASEMLNDVMKEE